MGISLSQYMMMEARLGKKLVGPVEKESDLHNLIAGYCKGRGWLCFRGSTAHRTYRTLGEPDLIVCADKGRTFFVECKKPKQKLKPEQLGIKIMLEKLGHKAAVIYSLTEFLELVK